MVWILSSLVGGFGSPFVVCFCCFNDIAYFYQKKKKQKQQLGLVWGSMIVVLVNLLPMLAAVGYEKNSILSSRREEFTCLEKIFNLKF